MRGQWKPTQLIQIELETNRAGNKASFLGQWTLEWEGPSFESQLFQLLAACGGKMFSS